MDYMHAITTAVNATKITTMKMTVITTIMMRTTKNTSNDDEDGQHNEEPTLTIDSPELSSSFLPSFPNPSPTITTTTEWNLAPQA